MMTNKKHDIRDTEEVPGSNPGRAQQLLGKLRGQIKNI